MPNDPGEEPKRSFDDDGERRASGLGRLSENFLEESRSGRRSRSPLMGEDEGGDDPGSFCPIGCGFKALRPV